MTVEAGVSAGESVAMKAAKGNVTIGADVKAGQEATLETGTGDIMIGRNGKGSVTANSDVKVAANNGDISIEGSVESQKGNVAMLAKGGSMIVGAEVKAGRNVSAEADGNVIVDAGVSAGESVTVNTDKGDILIGADVKAGGAVTMMTNIGDILVGSDGEGSEGNISIGKAVASSQGSVTVQTEAGEVYIGNDPEAYMVTARQDVTLRNGNGLILIDGGASTEKGDILVKAGNLAYTEGMDDNIAFGQDGRLTSGHDAYLIAQNGDLLVTRNVTAENTFYAQTKGQGNITFGEDLTVKNNLSLSTETGNITIGNDVTSQQGNLSMQVGTGNIQIGVNGYGSVTAKKDIDIAISKGNLDIATALRSNDGSLTAKIGSGNIHIGDNGPDVETVTAWNNAALETGNGKIEVFGKTSTINGDIALKAAGSEYAPGVSNIIIAQNGLLDSGRDLYMTGNNGDLHVTYASRAKRNLYAQVTGKGSLSYDTVNVDGSLAARTETGSIVIAGEATGNYVELGTGDGDISVGGDLISNTDANVSTNNGDISLEDVIANGDVSIYTGNGDVSTGNIEAGGNAAIGLNNGNLNVGDITAGGNASVAVRNGDADIGNVEAGGNASISVSSGNLNAGDITAGGNASVAVRNGDADIGSVEAGGNAAINVSTGNLDLGDMRAGGNASIKVSEGNLQAGNVTAGRNADVTVQNGNIQMHNVTAAKDATVSSLGNGSINANNIVAGETTKVSLTKGDLLLNLAEGRAVFLQMENNTEASKVSQVRAEASGGASPDVAMTGNFIQIGSIAAKGGDSVFELSAMGAGNQKLISGKFQVDSLRSRSGSHMPSLWANRGYMHVDEGNLSMDDVLAVDKIHLDNGNTDMAVYGRTPTRDGEQLAYWNDLSKAYSKERSFQLYFDGHVRTHGAILIDAGRNLRKLYGDNLSVVDMMRERVTNAHGTYTFDSMLLTEPGKALREVFFDMEPMEADIRQQSAAPEEIVVE